VINSTPDSTQVPLTCKCSGDWEVYALGERRFDAKGNLRGTILRIVVCQCNAPLPTWFTQVMQLPYSYD
jgi:hypothetical protein